MIIKVCGMREPKNIREVVKAGADWIGLIFWPSSPRYALHSSLFTLHSSLPLVGVFVDEEISTIVTTAATYHLTIIQLHGSESPEYIKRLADTLPEGTKIMKALSLPRDDYHPFLIPEVDVLLFDTACNTVGGSGRKFDWNLINDYDGNKPFLLSGGIGPDDAQAVRAVRHPQLLGCDLNSHFEVSPGVKDATKVRTFIEQVRKT